jgi:hypothetical protein
MISRSPPTARAITATTVIDSASNWRHVIFGNLQGAKMRVQGAGSFDPDQTRHYRELGERASGSRRLRTFIGERAALQFDP